MEVLFNQVYDVMNTDNYIIASQKKQTLLQISRHLKHINIFCRSEMEELYSEIIKGEMLKVRS